MRLPGFTAESSFYSSLRCWSAASGGLENTARLLVLPQYLNVFSTCSGNCCTFCTIYCNDLCLRFSNSISRCCDIECHRTCA
jgi:hypothetical protein